MWGKNWFNPHLDNKEPTLIVYQLKLVLAKKAASAKKVNMISHIIS